MEPAWMKNIPSWAVCNWFYTFFMVNVLVMAVLIISLVFSTLLPSVLPNKMKHTVTTTPFVKFLAFIQLLVAGTNMLFYYIICDRSLQPTTE
jgi:hypothetical protein